MPSTSDNPRVSPMVLAVCAELKARGFTVRPGEMGENITTDGLALLALPEGTRRCIGQSAVVQITGLRNPCAQLDRFQAGLMGALFDRDAAGQLVRKAGIMGIVIADGIVVSGDSIRIDLPEVPHRPLAVV